MLDLIINPFATLLLLFYSLLGENVFLAIVAFTITIRTLLIPLTLKQQRSMKAMQAVQPEMKALQEKYKNEREVLVQKQMELYREYKINPMAGCLPILVQLPILLGLWRAIIATLALSPGDLIDLSDRILIPGLEKMVPLDHQFLWLNLAVPDPYLILPLLVFVTTWVQQRLLTPPAPKKKSGASDDPADQAAAMTRQMTTFMPIMFGFFALTYSSGLSIYFIISNLFGIIQYTAMGNADYRRLFGKSPADQDDDQLVEASGRKRKAGIRDSRWDETQSPATTYTAPEGDLRSQRFARAKAKANRAKIKPS